MASGPAPRSGMGCATMIAIAFGVLALLALATCGGAAYWALSPGSQKETARLVGEESLGYVELTDLASSQPVANLLKSLAEELERRNPDRDAGPEWLRSLQSANRDYQSMLDYVMPNSLVFTLEPGQGGIAWMTAANFSGFTRPARLLLARVAEDADGNGPMANVVPYKDSTIYEFPQGASLAFLDGTFVAAAAAPSAQKAIDRLNAAERARAPLLELEAPRPGSWDARGALSGPSVALLGIGPDLARMARLGLRMDDPDTASGYLVVDCPGEAEAANLEQVLRAQLDERAAALAEEGLEVEFEVVRKASAVDVDLKFGGVRDYLLTKLEPAAEPDAELSEEEMSLEEVPFEEEAEEEPLEEGAPQEETPAVESGASVG